jgi:negative regulator of sigma E activity
MTGGSNHGGSGQSRSDQSGAASRLLPPRDGRETLSALLDGELPGEAARFAIKRLSHDVQWRDTCGRWQLIGDALRGQATAVAPPDFATAVARALGAVPGADNEIAATIAPSAAMARPRGRWLGGVALAASLAVAAVLVVKPFSPAPSGQSVPVVAGIAPAPAVTPPVVAEAPASTGGGSDATSPVAAPPAAPRALRTARVAPRAAATGQPAPQVHPPVQVAEVAAATEGAPGPFQPPAHDIATRPWPRAVLPGATAAGALTVGLEGSSSSPEFYPFEPQSTSSPVPENDSPSPP